MDKRVTRTMDKRRAMGEWRAMGKRRAVAGRRSVDGRRAVGKRRAGRSRESPTRAGRTVATTSEGLRSRRLVGQSNPTCTLFEVPQCVELSLAMPKLSGESMPEMSEGQATKVPAQTMSDELEGQHFEAESPRHTTLV